MVQVGPLREHLRVASDGYAYVPLGAAQLVSSQLFVGLPKGSVGDPDSEPDPQDPHVFGPPGSGSISQRYGSGSGFTTKF
jgi:hypothetical protein